MLDAIEIETGPNPTASIVVLHGLGADGNDFVPFASELKLGAVGPVRFVFPHAPTRPVTINNGAVMRAWYDIATFEGIRREDESGLRASAAAVEEILARERSRGVPSRRIVLSGFSQGCATTLMTGLRHAEPLAGLAGLSGYLPLAAKTEAERHAANQKTPIFLAHGRQDPVLPRAWGAAARDALQALQYDVEWHEYAMPHSVCVEEVADLNRWLIKVLSTPVASL